MSKVRYILLVALVALLSVACQRRPMDEEYLKVYLDLTIDQNVKNHEYTDPGLMRVAFFDSFTGEYLSHDYVESTGGYIFAPYGTVDMVATDHAPHSAEEKSRVLEKSAFGIVGIETALPILYTHLVKPGILTLEKLAELLVTNPRKRFHIPLGCEYSIWDLNAEYTIDPEEFLSMGKATPFAGWKSEADCLVTVCGGKAVRSYVLAKFARNYARF